MGSSRERLGVLALAALGAVFVLGGTGCAEEPALVEPAPVSTSGSEAPQGEVPSEAVSASPGSTADEHACFRAADCCEAYIHGMVAISPSLGELDAEVTCNGVRIAAQAGAEAEPGCQAAIDGWRHSLVASNVPVPTVCQ